MKLRMFLCSLAVVPLTVTPAIAGGEPPQKEVILKAKTASVLPVLTTGNRAAQYRAIGASITTASKGSDVAPSSFIPAMGEQGFGFAGQATENDTQILRLATLLGASTAQRGDADALRQSAESIAGARQVLASLDPNLVAAVDRYVASARQGVVDGEALATAFSLAEAGIAKGPARGHGYFVTGLWLGLTLLYAANPGDASALVDMTHPIATFLEEDAEFGGADRKLAAEVRRIGALFGAAQVDYDALKDSLSRALSVTADAP
jgi:hypothetical protein